MTFFHLKHTMPLPKGTDPKKLREALKPIAAACIEEVAIRGGWQKHPHRAVDAAELLATSSLEYFGLNDVSELKQLMSTEITSQDIEKFPARLGIRAKVRRGPQWKEEWSDEDDHEAG